MKFKKEVTLLQEVELPGELKISRWIVAIRSGLSGGERKKNFDEQRRLCCSKMLYASFSKSRD